MRSSFHRTLARLAGCVALLAALGPLVVSVPPTTLRPTVGPVAAAVGSFARSPSLAIGFGPGVTAAERRALIARIGGTRVRWIPALHTVAVDLPRGRLAQAEHVLETSRTVRSVGPDYVRSIAGTGGFAVAASSQWNLRRIGWPAAVARLRAKRTVRLAVVDTGVDASVPALRGIVLPGFSVFRGSSPSVDPNGHGTAMASIAAAALRPGGLAGVADAGVRILPVQALNAQGMGRDSGIERGILWAARHGANVILLSFDGAGYSAALQRAVSFAWSKGAVVVAATGNNGSPNATFPAGDAKVVGVSATDRHDHLWAGSNYGPDTLLGAPGVDVPAYAPGGTTRLVTGTSASAASVAGAASLLMAAHPQLSNAAVVGRLAATAAAAGTRRQTGYGRLDLGGAAVRRGTRPLVPRGVRGRVAGGAFGGSYRAATALSGVTVGATRSAAAARAEYTVGFTTSASGALAAGNTITVAFPTNYLVPSSPAPAIGGLGSFGCSGTASVATRTITITLADSGGTCAIGASTTVPGLTIDSVTNATTAGSKSITVKSSKDTTAATGTFSVTAATSVTGVSFTAPRLMAGATTTYTADFTTSGTGAFAAGDSVTVVFPTGYVVGASPNVVLGAGFANCSATASVAARTVTIALGDSGGPCAVGNTAAASLTVDSITNPTSAATKTITVATSADSSAGSGAVIVAAKGALSSVTVAGADSTAGVTTTYTADFTTDTNGSLAAGDTITVTFAATYSVASNPAITLGPEFANCSATSPGGSSTVVITLADSGGTCSLGASTATSLQVGSVTNPTVTGSKANKVSDSADTTLVSDSFSITPGVPAFLTFSVEPSGGSVDSAITPAIKVKLLDQYGNLTTSTDRVALTGAPLVGTTTVAAVNGTATFSGLHVHVAGTGYQLTASDADDGGVTTALSSSFDMTVGALAALDLQAASTTPTAGATDDLTITAQDQYGNTETSYTGPHSLTFSGPGSIGGHDPTVTDASGVATTLGTATSVAFTSGVATVSGADNGVAAFYEAQSVNLVVSDGSVSNGSGLALVVQPAAATQLAYTSGGSNVAAGSVKTLTAAVEDTYGNVETADNATVVSFALGAGPGTVDGLANATVSSGVASLGVTGHTAGSVTIHAAAGAWSDDSTFSVVAGPVARLAYGQGPTGGSVDGAISPAVTVELLDTYGNLTSSTDRVQLAFAAGHDNGATLANGGPAAAVAGVATFFSLQIRTVGTSYELTATDADHGSATAATSAAFDMTVGAPAKLAFTSDGSSVTAGATKTLTAAVEDAWGNVETGDGATVVGFAQTGAGTVDGLPASATVSAGIASFDVTGHTAGAVTITASQSGLTSGTSTFSVLAGAVTQLAFTQQPTTTSVDDAIAPAVTVALEDAYGNVTTSTDHVALSFTSGHDNGGSLLGGGSRAAVAGVATFATLHIHRAATGYELTATDATNGVIPTVDSSTFDMTPGAETKLAYSQAPTTSSVDGPVSPAVTVAVEDQYGNLTGSTDQIQVAFASGFDNGATLTGGGSTAAVAGTATFSNLGITLASTGYKLTATDASNGSITGVTSAAFTMRAGAATQLTFSLEPATTSVDVALPSVQVELLDQYGNLTTSNDHVALALAAGHDNGGTLLNGGSKAASGGKATFTTLHVHLAATGYELTATDVTNGSIPAVTSTGFDMTVGAATRLAFTSDGSSVAAGSTKTLSVAVEDQYGNLETGDSGTVVGLARTAGTGSVDTLANATASAGVASLDVTGHAAGPLTVTATASGLTSATSAFSVVPGPATQVVFTSGTASVAAGSTKTLTTQLEDAYGNVETGDGSTVVSFALSSGPGSLDGLANATVSAGVASLGVTGHTAGSVTVTASSGVLTADSSTFAVVPGPVSQLAFDQGPSGGSVDDPIAPAVTVQLLDAYGNLTSSTDRVQLGLAAAHDNGTTLSGVTEIAAVAGVATFSDAEIHRSGTGYELTAADADSGSATVATSASFDMSVGTATQIAFTSGASSVAAGTAKTLAAAVEDQYGNVETGDGSTSVHFAESGTGTVDGLPADATASSGVASLDVTGHTAGSVTITATSGSWSDTSTFPVVAGAATQLAFAQEPTTSSVDTAISPAVTVVLEDQFGNVTASHDHVKLTFATGFDNGGTLLNGGSRAASAGVATFSTLHVHKASSGYELTATDVTDGSVAAADSTSFDMTPGAETKLVFTQQPTTSSVDGPVSPAVAVTIEDQYRNVVTGSTDPVDVTFAAGHDNGQPLDDTVDASAGVATFSNLQIHLAATGYELTATDGLLQANSATFTMKAGAATQLAFSEEPVTTSVDDALPAVQVELLDQYGNLSASTDHVALDFASGHDNGGTLLNGTRAAGGGKATFTTLHIHLAATGYELTATDTDNGSIPAVTSTSFDMTVGAATRLAFTSDTTAVAAGSAKTLTAQVEDRYGNLEASDGATVASFAQSGTGSVDGLSAAAAASSGAFSLNVTGHTAGAVTVTASAPGLTSGTTTFSVDPGPATQLAVTSSSADLAAGSVRTLEAQVEDAFGNLETSDDSTAIGFAQTSGSGTVDGLAGATASGGVASLGVTGHAAGPVTITASASGLAEATSAFSVVPGSATQLAFTSDGSSVAAGSAKTLTAQVEDALGNVESADSSTVVSFQQTAGAGTVGSSGSATVSGGVASLGVTGHTTGPVTVTASASGLASDTSTFSVVPGTASRLVFASDGANVAAGSSKPLTAEVEDAYGNLETADDSTVVTFAQVSGAGSVDGLGKATASGGVASLRAAGHTAGQVTIRASAGGSSATSTFDVVPGPVSRLLFTSDGSSVDAGSAKPLTVRVEDAYGNLETDDGSTVVDFVQTSGSGSVDGLGAATASGGVASLAVTGRTAGRVAVAASAAGAARDTSTFDVLPGAARQLVFAQQPADGSVDGPISPAVTVDVLDRYGNRTSSTDRIQLTLASGHDHGATLLGGDATAASGGEATFSSLAIHRAGSGYELTATDLDGAAVPAESASFARTPGAVAARESTIQASPDVIVANGGDTATIVVQAVDRYGNRVRHGGASVALSTDHGTFAHGCTVGCPAADRGDGTYAATLTAPASDTDLTATIRGSVDWTALAAVATVDLTGTGTGRGSGSATHSSLALARSGETGGSGGHAHVAVGGRGVTVTVTVANASGRPLRGKTVELDQSLSGGGRSHATIVAVSTSSSAGVAAHDPRSSAGVATNQATTGGDGRVTFEVRDERAEAVVLTARDLTDSVTIARSVRITYAARRATHLGFARQPATGSADAAISPAVAVVLLDRYGNVVRSRDRIALRLASRAPLLGGGPRTASGGQAVFADLRVHAAGRGYELVATDPDDRAVAPARSRAFAISPGAPARLVFVHGPSGGPVDRALPSLVTVELVDRYGNRTHSTVRVELAIGGGQRLGVTTARAGIATFAGLHVHKAGSYALTATAHGGAFIVPATSSAFAMTPGAPTTLRFARRPRGGSVDDAIPPVTVVLLDRYGNRTSASDRVVLALAAGHDHGTRLLGGGATAARAGEATFAGLHVHTASGGYELVATDLDRKRVQRATSASFDMTAGSPARLTFARQPVGGPVDAVVAPVVVDVLDRYGNLTASADRIALALAGVRQGTLAGGVVAASAGVATFRHLRVGTSGTFELVATDSRAESVVRATSASFEMRGNASGGDELAVLGAATLATLLVGGLAVALVRRRRAAYS